MGRRGIWTSAAAGASLVVAALIVVAAISTLIAFRGFPGVQATAPAPQSVVIDPSADRERGNILPKPKAVVIGGARKAPAAGVARKRRSGRAASSRTASRGATASGTRVSRRTVRSRPSAPVREPSTSSPAAAAAPTRQSEPTADLPAVAPTATPPVDKLVEDVAAVVEDVSGVEKVGDVLLDVRDLLP